MIPELHDARALPVSRYQQLRRAEDEVLLREERLSVLRQAWHAASWLVRRLWTRSARLAGVADYSVAGQPAQEDLANALQVLAGDNANHVTRARELMRSALTKLRKGEPMAEGPTCSICGAPVTVSRLVKGRAKGQLSLKCTDKECGARTFVSTKAAVAKFTARYPHLVASAPASAEQPAAPAGAPGAGAGAAAQPAQPTRKVEQMPAELANATGPDGRRRRAEWERAHRG